MTHPNRKFFVNNQIIGRAHIFLYLSEDELKAIVLSDEELKKKEEIAINNQIKRFIKKQEQQDQKEKKIKLKKLNKPK